MTALKNNNLTHKCSKLSTLIFAFRINLILEPSMICVIIILSIIIHNVKIGIILFGNHFYILYKLYKQNRFNVISVKNEGHSWSSFYCVDYIHFIFNIFAHLTAIGKAFELIK